MQKNTQSTNDYAVGGSASSLLWVLWYYRGSVPLGWPYIHSVQSFFAPGGFKSYAVIFRYGACYIIDVYKYTLLCLQIADETETFGLIEKGYDARTQGIIFPATFIFGNANYNVFQVYFSFAFRIGWGVHNIAILIHISHHVFQALATTGTRPAFTLFFCLILSVFLFFLFPFFFLPALLRFCHIVLPAFVAPVPRGGGGGCVCKK